VNLLFLVEGEKTEPKVYRAWLKHLFPDLIFVKLPEEMTSNTCCIISGYGYPQMVSKPKNSSAPSFLEACLMDIKNFNNVDHFFICIDSDNDSYSKRFNEVQSKIEVLKLDHKIDDSKTEIHLIIQNCCFETWALGNAEISQKYARIKTSTIWLDFQNHYDILLNDPENLNSFPAGYPFRTKRNKAKLHKRYLEIYLSEFGLSYRKEDPKLIAEKHYLESLQTRCKNTEHLPSLRLLFDIWENLY
jgi:hypothetical protein